MDLSSSKQKYVTGTSEQGNEFLVLYNPGNFLTSSGIIRFSRINILHELNGWLFGCLVSWLFSYMN
jgi:hypothetical protein